MLFNHAGVEVERLTFHTLSGALYAKRAGDGVWMDFPRNDPVAVEPIEPILSALGLEAYDDFQYSITNQKLLVLLGDSGEVAGLQPDFDVLHSAENTLGWRGVIATEEGTGEYDFVSRYFAPWMGIDEDPVTRARTGLGGWGRR
ncbi:MAG: PhzF family phenazine biosynthesis protein [Candidatus Bathyarchaeota archaeon]|nr:MAG: PhzF family phenazine biosynthesis protein [Candidatus Bathyarchaeota archaeon]